MKYIYPKTAKPEKSIGSMGLLSKYITALLIAGMISTAASADVDPAIKLMLKTAIISEDPAQLSVVKKVALAAWPEQAEAIETLIGELSAAAKAEKNAASKITDAKDKKNALTYYLSPALWNGQLELGGGTSTGNTKEQGLSVGLSFKRIFNKKWEHDLDANLDFTRSQGITTKRKVIGEYKLLWKPWDRFYAMNFLQIEADKFSGYKYRITENIGIGYEILNNKKMLWRLEGGPGIRYNKLYITEIGETEFLALISNTFEMNLFKNMKFSNKSSAVFTNAAFSIDNKAQLSARINAHLAAKLSFAVKHDTGVPADKSKTDTISRATLVYDF